MYTPAKPTSLYTWGLKGCSLQRLVNVMKSDKIIIKPIKPDITKRTVYSVSLSSVLFYCRQPFQNSLNIYENQASSQRPCVQKRCLQGLVTCFSSETKLDILFIFYSVYYAKCFSPKRSLKYGKLCQILGKKTV